MPKTQNELDLELVLELTKQFEQINLISNYTLKLAHKILNKETSNNG